MFRWFLDVPIDASGIDHSVFSKNRKRLLEQDVAQEFFERVVELARKENLLSESILRPMALPSAGLHCGSGTSDRILLFAKIG